MRANGPQGIAWVLGQTAGKLLKLGRGKRYDRWEWAGAFGDIGTLIPFVLAYITLLKMDPGRTGLGR